MIRMFPKKSISEKTGENPKKDEFDAAGENHFQEYDDSFAATILASLKHSKLDKETSSLLQILKFKFRIRYLSAPAPPAFEKAKGFGKTIDGKILPRIPPIERLTGFIGRCSNPFEKQLTLSDVDDHQHRLALNCNDVEYALLPLLYPEEDLASGVLVTTYDLEGKEYRMHFKHWHPRHYVLIGEWKRFCHEHALRPHEDWVTVWMFRHACTDKPCFVITSRRLPPIHITIRRHSKGNLQRGPTKCRGLQQLETKKKKKKMQITRHGLS